MLEIFNKNNKLNGNKGVENLFRYHADNGDLVRNNIELETWNIGNLGRKLKVEELKIINLAVRNNVQFENWTKITEMGTCQI